MGWAKFDDRYSEHPKIVAAGPLAELLDRRAIEYCARQETDGFVPEQQARRLCSDLVMDLGADWIELVKTLVGVGRWSETAGGYTVHDFTDYHPTRAQKNEERAAARERMAKNRQNKGKRSGDVQTNTAQNNGANNGRGSHYPVPDPLPQPQNPPIGPPDDDQDDDTPPPATKAEAEPKAKTKRASQLPDDWKPNDTHHELADTEHVDLDRELAKFIDHHLAKGSTFKDWDRAFANWIRRANEFGATSSRTDRNALARLDDGSELPL